MQMLQNSSIYLTNNDEKQVDTLSHQLLSNVLGYLNCECCVSDCDEAGVLSSGLPVFRTLLAESESKLFPDNDLLRRLRLVTQDAEKCSSVAQQLLNGKRQTRYH